MPCLRRSPSRTVPVSPATGGPAGPSKYHHGADEVPCAVLRRAEPLSPNVAGECHGRAYRCGGPRRRAEAMSHPSVTPAKPPLAVRIETEKSHPLAWKTVAKRAVVVLIAGVSIYLVFPAITEVLASWPRLSTLDPRWFAVAIGAEIAHFSCTFALQRLALRTRAWFPVITSQLAGNAVTLIMPGGAAVGAALQFRMLATSGRRLQRQLDIGFLCESQTDFSSFVPECEPGTLVPGASKRSGIDIGGPRYPRPPARLSEF